MDHQIIRGARKVSIDITFAQSGDVDLGETIVHVWDPAKKAYATARAKLGKVHVVAAALSPARKCGPPC